MAFSSPQWDTQLFSLINDTWRTPFLDVLMPLISNSVLVWGIVALVALGGALTSSPPKRKRIAGGLLLVLLVAGISDLGCGTIKDTFGRVRPLNALPSVHFVEKGQWTQRSTDFVQTKAKGASYISAHAANSMAAVLVGCALWPGLRWLMLPLPLLIGWSRVYLGKHYPSDVLAAWLFGLAIALLVLQCQRCVVEFMRRRMQTRVMPPAPTPRQ